MENRLKRKRVASDEELKTVHRFALSGHIQPLTVRDVVRPSSAPTISTASTGSAPRRRTHHHSADSLRIEPPKASGGPAAGSRSNSQLRDALARLQDLQDDLLEVSSMDSDDSELQDHLEGLSGPTRSRLDPEALGFLVCAQETMKYLNEQGITANDPMVVNLRNRFVNGLNRLGID